MSENYNIDVLIAGAGPTGSTLAADLLRRGLRVRLVEKAPHAFNGSRAKGIQPRTLEIFKDLDILDEALAEGGSYPLTGLHFGFITLPWRMIKKNSPTQSVPYPNTLLLPQYKTDAILHRLINRFGQQIEFNTAIEGFEQDIDGVTVTLSSGEKVRCKYLIGADGGSSTVRKTAGIGFVGETDDSDKWLIIDGKIDKLSRNRWHMWPRKHGKQVAACPLPHSSQFQIMIRLKPGEMPNLNEDMLSEQFYTLTGFRLHSITWSSVFRPNIRLAKNYRAGRIFLVGDAAHVHTPAGGQGLNTGVQDAYNLGWKLGQVISGANESLLDSYEAERQPIAASVLGKSTELYASLGKRNLSSLKRGDEERQLRISYHGGPLAPINTPSTKTLQVGDRAPDASCIGPGSVRSLFDLYKGPHFTLLAFGVNATKALLEIKSPTNGATLQSYAVHTKEVDSEDYICDVSGKLCNIYGITDDTLILIRPDGYIGCIIKKDWLTTFNKIIMSIS
ncbi:FAD-dependent monooxygenase [Paenibacillus sp. ACRSA]|uniref:FAD-dependent monooxygenase n=1 Tax=Paenibacillus sp. ACRSA TaxID=2918211 RepID=UPI001EF7075E|nr:FAD-dependent monooxygenase [Paenibacillus sp. ACRSA]MCG7379428.1 FAD-dependent monooxygenase [Paenibacillus sp. ACRSA]